MDGVDANVRLSLVLRTQSTGTTMVKIASVSSWFLGLGFGIPCVYGIWNS
jgi:hypothetical protein